MAAQGIEQNKAQSELKQAALEQQQHSVIQPLACAPEHCVYICNLTYPLGSQRGPPPTSLVLLSLSLSLSTITTMFSRSLRALVSILFLCLSLSRSHRRVIAFFSLTQRYSQANTPTHFLTLTPMHKHTEGLEDTPMCEDRAVLMCQGHYSLLRFFLFFFLSSIN